MGGEKEKKMEVNSLVASLSVFMIISSSSPLYQQLGNLQLRT